jgi:hypothetical protein
MKLTSTGRPVPMPLQLLNEAYTQGALLRPEQSTEADQKHQDLASHRMTVTAPIFDLR